MDWSKVDAALAGALADAEDGGERSFPVFIHLDAEQADPSLLAELEVDAPAGGVSTASLSAAAVDRLTDHPWVTRVQLSGSLGLLGDRSKRSPPVAVGPPMDHHGASRPRGTDHVPRSSISSGRYGRMFRTLAPLVISDAEITALADSMSDAPDPSGDNPDVPAGYTYLGQFIDHDITFDLVSSLDRLNDPDALHDFRTPRFDLDSLYGGGPVDSPYLYDQDDRVKLLVGHNPAPIHEAEDLPRNEQGRALIGDPRNDVHVIISQLQLAFIRFHNAIVDHLRQQFRPESEIFDEARRLARWHYQWVVVHDHLHRLVGHDVLDDVLVTDAATGAAEARLRFFTWKRQPFMPVEFSAAAYRFGHSQVRSGYRLNVSIPGPDDGDTLPILTDIRTPNPLQHLGGFRPLPKGWTVEWKRFFPLDPAFPPQPSRRIDTRISAPMRNLPADIDDQRRSIALLNLKRGQALQLPSGQAVAAALGTAAQDSQLGLHGSTPLWFYLLKEAEVVGDGLRLGPTGARIVAEVLVGLLKGDPQSFLRQAPAWKPELPSAAPGQFTMGDLLSFAAGR